METVYKTLGKFKTSLMTRYIAILRGINVSGQKKIIMTDLIEIMSQIGFSNTKTYIQSGNLIFDYKKTDLIKLAALIKEKILEAYHFDIPVIVLKSEEIQTIIQNNPFEKEFSVNPKIINLTFLAQKPKEEYINELKASNYPNEHFKIKDKAIYLYTPNGYGKAKLSNVFLEKKLQVSATTRNWNTVLKLFEIGNE